MGEIGREEERREQEKEKEEQGERKQLWPDKTSPTSLPETSTEILVQETVDVESLEQNGDALQAVLREEAFAWPRLVFAPLKNSGHIILDACTAEGK